MTHIEAEEHADDQWLVDGQPSFGVIPGGILEAAPNDTPIFLYRGDATYGALHIRSGHGHWVNRQGLSVPELVWRKCQQTGSMYSTDQRHKLNIALTLSPSALMVLRYIQAKGHFSVVTLYFRERDLDGEFLGRYQPIKWTSSPPTFSLKPYQRPEIIFKKKRTLIIP